MPKPPPIVYWLVALSCAAAFCAGLAMAVRGGMIDGTVTAKAVARDLQFEQQMRHQYESTRRCREQGHVPVLGFGFRVVCVSGQVAIEDLTTGEHPQQGAK